MKRESLQKESEFFFLSFAVQRGFLEKTGPRKKTGKKNRHFFTPRKKKLFSSYRGRAVDEHARDLHLAVGVEGDQADVGVGERLGRRLDLLEDLRRVGAAEHGQLVHRPVAVVLVADRVADADGVGVGDVGLAGVGELERRDPAVAGDVVDLLGDVGVRERGQVGEGLEEPERLVGGRSRRRRTRIGGEEIEEREGRGERGERREREREKESEEERRRRREGGD